MPSIRGQWPHPTITAFGLHVVSGHRRLPIFQDDWHRLGWVSRRAQQGDMVCVLYGGAVPFVLREMDDGCCRMIGECYVDGLMQGEAMQMRDVPDYTFNIY
jgi:hypothetical protein